MDDVVSIMMINDDHIIFEKMSRGPFYEIQVSLEPYCQEKN